MRKVSNIFEPKASRVLRGLLSNPRKKWSIRDIAKEVQVSVGYTHAVVSSLLDLGYVARNEYNLLEVTDPLRLLERWASYHRYDYQNSFLEYYSYAREIDDILNRLKLVETGYAATTLIGAFLVSPFVRPTKVELYVRDEKIVKALSMKLGAIPTTGEGNIQFVLPYDDGVFYMTRRINNITIVSDVQLYVDLVNYPTRGEEASQQIYNKLREEWSLSLLEGTKIV